VIVRGEALALEYRDGRETERFEVCAGQADWDAPTDRVHRALNIGGTPYEEVTIFFSIEPTQYRNPSPNESAAVCRLIRRAPVTLPRDAP